MFKFKNIFYLYHFLDALFLKLYSLLAPPIRPARHVVIILYPFSLVILQQLNQEPINSISSICKGIEESVFPNSIPKRNRTKRRRRPTQQIGAGICTCECHLFLVFGLRLCLLIPYREKSIEGSRLMKTGATGQQDGRTALTKRPKQNICKPERNE